jgi:23S rRNA (pseudouridine1915-N3)-methyltransferase
MLTINIIAVGSLKESYLKEGCAEYLKRLRAWAKLNIYEIDEERLSDNPSQADINTALDAEGVRIDKQLSKGQQNGFVISLCVEGEKLKSEAFAQLLDKQMVSGSSSVSLVIGGSFGLSQAIKHRSDFMLSISDMTFPHQLVRLMLLEQTYRAMSIINGSKYHK